MSGIFRGVIDRRVPTLARRGQSGNSLTTLSFSNLTYANASSRYGCNGTTVYGPFDPGIPTIITIDGIRYLQSFESRTQSIPRSDRLDNSWWNVANLGLAVATPNTATAPDGSATACRLNNDTDEDAHSKKLGTAFLTSWGVFSIFCKKGTQGVIAGIAFSPDGSGPLTWIPQINWARYALLQPTQNNRYPIIMNKDSYNGSGIVGDNHLFWCAQVELSKYYAGPPAVNNTGSSLVIAKDEAYYAAGAVPSWLKTKPFIISIIPYYSSTELASENANKYIASFETSAEILSLYLSADGKINLVGSVFGSLLVTGAHTWSAFQKCTLQINLNNGSNSTIKTTGWTGSGTTTGTSNGYAINGAIYHGMASDLSGQFNGWVSEFIQQ